MFASVQFEMQRLTNDTHLFSFLCSGSSLQKIFIEYIMLDGVNDEELQAHQLGKLLETLEVVSVLLFD